MQTKLIKTRARCCRSILPARQVAWTRPVICVPVITFAWLAADHAWNSLCRNKYVNLTYTHSRTHIDLLRACVLWNANSVRANFALARVSTQEMFIVFTVAIVISTFFNGHRSLNKGIFNNNRIPLQYAFVKKKARQCNSDKLNCSFLRRIHISFLLDFFSTSVKQ